MHRWLKSKGAYNRGHKAVQQVLWDSWLAITMSSIYKKMQARMRAQQDCSDARHSSAAATQLLWLQCVHSQPDLLLRV